MIVFAVGFGLVFSGIEDVMRGKTFATTFRMVPHFRRWGSVSLLVLGGVVYFYARIRCSVGAGGTALADTCVYSGYLQTLRIAGLDVGGAAAVFFAGEVIVQILQAPSNMRT